MKELKYLFCDLDGTLLVRDKSDLLITKDDLDALKMWTNAGNKFYIMTGRHAKDIQSLIKKYDLKVDGYTSSNGGAIFNGDGVLLKADYISDEVAVDMLTFLSKEEIYVDYSDGIYKFLKEQYKYPDDGVANNLSGIVRLENLITNLKYNKMIEMSFVLTFTEHATIAEKLAFAENFKATIGAKHNDKIDYFQSYHTKGFIAVTSKNVNKGGAANFMIDKLKISPEQCYAIGDGENDFELLNVVGHPSCMKIAHQKLKDSGFVSSINVAEFIKRSL